MPAPKNRHRYLGSVTRPDGSKNQELFLSIRDARAEAESRAKTTLGSRILFTWEPEGHRIAMAPDGTAFTNQQNVFDRFDPGTTIHLYDVHRDGRVETRPRFRVTVGPRGGTYYTKLRVHK